MHVLPYKLTSLINDDKLSNVTTNHRSSRTQRFAKYALKTRMVEVLINMDPDIYPIHFHAAWIQILP
jgi:hypothetical protein